MVRGVLATEFAVLFKQSDVNCVVPAYFLPSCLTNCSFILIISLIFLFKNRIKRLRNSPGRNTGVCCHALFQRIF